MLRPRRCCMAAVLVIAALCVGLSPSMAIMARAGDKAAATANDKKAAKPEAKPAEKPSKAAAKTTSESSKPDEVKKAAKEEKAKEKEQEKRIVARIRVKGECPEGPASPGLFGGVQTSLARIVDRLDQVAEDDQVAAVILDIEEIAIGRGKLNELRAAVGRIRAAGKPVFAQLTGASAVPYLLASACDEIIVSPQAYVTIPGVRAEAVFFKGLLDKLGIKMQVLQMGKYKSAGEMFTNRQMSPAARENLEAMVDDVYASLVADIAKDRNLDEDRVKELIDRGLFTANGARKAGLVDHVIYPDELPAQVKKKLKTDEVEIVERYRKKRVDTNVSGVGGLMKLMEMAFGNKPEKVNTKARKIAVVYAVGMIVSGEGSDGMMSDSVVGAKTLVEALEKAASDDSVVAIVLRVDSPGGSAVASDLIWRAVMQVKAKKPVIASMGDVAGSGGYYIAMGANKILAEPLSITGSIGVIGAKPSISGLLDKAGISTEVISRGKNAASFSVIDPFTATERKAWMRLMKDAYHQFVAKAAQSREMPCEEVGELAQGRVYTGRMAVENGLVDRIGTLHDAVLEAKKAAKLKPDEKVDLWILPEPKTFLERLFADPAAMENAYAASTQFGGVLTKAVVLQRLFTEPSLVLMPQWITFK